MLSKVSMVSKYLLGLNFLIFGAAGLFNLIPPPPDMPEKLQTFMGGMAASVYFFPFLKLTETVCGLFLLLGLAPALMLIVLAPISIHIFLTHAFLTPGLNNLVLPIIIVILHVLAAHNYRELYGPLFNKNK